MQMQLLHARYGVEAEAERDLCLRPGTRILKIEFDLLGAELCIFLGTAFY